MPDPAPSIAEITLDERTVVSRSAEIEHERQTAIADLLRNNRFVLASGRPGPFHLHLAVEENRLAIEVRAIAEGSQETIMLPLRPFGRIVKDYFMVCESYNRAIRSGNLSQVEAIDMGRRGLHDEGSELLMERLADKVEIDHDTARRLFTLICVLHLKGSARALGPHQRL
ncbi:MAG: UPF0262 family protein [Alphaproteobacteria bacterium]|nr:UPF0262 family protein [Alphaproteobacteria bacterium]